MVEPLVSYLEPHGPPPLPARQGVSIGTAGCACLGFVVRYLFDHRLPFCHLRQTATVMARKRATPDELGARAEVNSYRRVAHREDSRRDCNKHEDKTKKDQDTTWDHYVMYGSVVYTLKRSILKWNLSWHYLVMKEDVLQKELPVPDQAFPPYSNLSTWPL